MLLKKSRYAPVNSQFVFPICSHTLPHTHTHAREYINSQLDPLSVFSFRSFCAGDAEKFSSSNFCQGERNIKKFAAGCFFAERDLVMPSSQFNIFAAWKQKGPYSDSQIGNSRAETQALPHWKALRHFQFLVHWREDWIDFLNISLMNF